MPIFLISNNRHFVPPNSVPETPIQSDFRDEGLKYCNALMSCSNDCQDFDISFWVSNAKKTNSSNDFLLYFPFSICCMLLTYILLTVILWQVSRAQAFKITVIQECWILLRELQVTIVFFIAVNTNKSLHNKNMFKHLNLFEIQFYLIFKF